MRKKVLGRKDSSSEKKGPGVHLLSSYSLSGTIILGSRDTTVNIGKEKTDNNQIFHTSIKFTAVYLRQ